MSENTESNEIPTLFPELLSFDELKRIIEKRHPRLRNLSRMTHEEAVKLFRNMLLPLPQRDYSHNSRGRRLQEKRMRSGLQARSSPDLSTSSQESLQKIKRLTSTDRLKPPPDLSSSSKIRLSAKKDSDTHRSNTSAIENLVIKTRTSSERKSTEDATSRPNKRTEPPSSQTTMEVVPEKKSKRMKITWP